MKSEKKRLIVAARIFFILLTLVDLRFFYLQMIHYKTIDKAVVKQRVRKIVQQPERGVIEDGDGNVLAMSEMAYNIAIYPNLIKTKQEQQKVATTLSQILNINLATIMNTVKENVDWASVAKGVSPSKAIQIQKANLGAVEISQAPKRVYPGGSTAADILGFVNQVGQAGAGIEISMNKYLSGVPGYSIAETDPLGRVIPIGLQSDAIAQKGDTVHLTINSYMQYVLQQNLNKAEKNLKAKNIYGIIMDPNTGKILAMASTPTFNPNQYAQYPERDWNNSPISYNYAPGSVMKPVIMTMALSGGYLKPNQTYDDPGYVDVNGVYLHDDTANYNRGRVDLNTIITQSLNVGMVHVGDTMTPKEEYAGLLKAGFGQTTGVELPGESTGIIPTFTAFQNPVNKATVSYGQGIAVTPLQILTADSEVINGGHQIHPHIVSKVVDNYGNIVYQPNFTDTKQLYQSWAANLVKGFLRNDMMVSGTMVGVQIPGYVGGGKTGTASIFKNGKIVPATYNGSVFAYFPYKKPKYTILIAVNQPNKKGVLGYGAEVAGPIVKATMTTILHHEDVPMTDSTTAPKNSNMTVTVPNVKGLLLSQAEAELKQDAKKTKIQVNVKGTGQIVSNQNYIYQGNQLVVGLQTEPIYNQYQWNIPDLIGRTKAEIETIFKGSGISLHFIGSGKTIHQSITVGTYNEKPKSIEIWLNS